MASSPRIITQTGAVRRRSFEEKPIWLFIVPPRAQASRRCETQATLAASRQALLAFRSLDPFRALREPDRRRRDEERPSRSEQRTLSKAKNNRLTGKAPYKFESPLLHRRVNNEPCGCSAIWRAHGRKASFFPRGTDGSNPASSSGESGTNRTPSLRGRRSIHQLDRYRRDIRRLGRQRRYGFDCDVRGMICPGSKAETREDGNMRRSLTRIRTSHVGRLPPPKTLNQRLALHPPALVHNQEGSVGSRDSKGRCRGAVRDTIEAG